jgi:hypothetical protein
LPKRQVCSSVCLTSILVFQRDGGFVPLKPEGVLVGDAHNFRVMNLELPAKECGVPAGWFISRGSRFGSPGPLVMS